jgi:zinc/manganese transport system permease protein
MNGLLELFSYHFMVNAFRAGTITALAAALIGWFAVLRRESFAAHTLAIAGVPGAAGATLLGASATGGSMLFCALAALAIATIPRGQGARGFSEEPAVIGVVQALALASGFLFVSLYHGLLTGTNALLFGNALGIADAQVLALGAVTLGTLVGLAAIARPLLFASIDPLVAAAHGVRVRLLSALFLLLLGLAAAEASQIVGALLVFALLVLPAATAQRLTARPLTGLALSAALALAATWLGLVLAYYTPYPASFYITTIAFTAFAATRLLHGRRPWRRQAAAPQACEEAR